MTFVVNEPVLIVISLPAVTVTFALIVKLCNVIGEVDPPNVLDAVNVYTPEPEVKVVPLCIKFPAKLTAGLPDAFQTPPLLIVIFPVCVCVPLEPNV